MWPGPVLDQNLVGGPRLRVRGPASAKVTLRFAEMLNPDATIYTTNDDVSIPANATATVYVPAVTEGGGPAEQSFGLGFLRNEDGRAVYAAGAK